MNNDFFFEMLKTSSVSGHEITLQKKVMNYMSGYADSVLTDYTGNVTHVINPQAPFKVMLAGHIDEIGLIITHVLDNGLIKVTNAGGIRPSMYPGHKVVIETNTGPIYGAVLVNSELKGDIKVEDLSIDIGAHDKKQALEYVQLGNPIRLDTNERLLLNNRVTARAIDDRGGAFICIEALKRAKEYGCKIGVYATTTVGEETSMRGAHWASARIKPNLGIAVDVTFATDYPSTKPWQSGDVKIGGGPVLCNSSIANKKANELLKLVASKYNIPYQIEAFVGRTGTDADKIHTSMEGFNTALVSLPLRYMHAPDELCSLDDIENCIELLARFLCEIDEKTNLDPFID